MKNDKVRRFFGGGDKPTQCTCRMFFLGLKICVVSSLYDKTLKSKNFKNLQNLPPKPKLYQPCLQHVDTDYKPLK